MPEKREQSTEGKDETAEDFVLAPRFSCPAPNFFDHFGLWMIEPESFRSAVQRVQGINLHLHIKSEEAAERVKQQSQISYSSTDDGIAVFRVQGPMMKTVSSVADGTSTTRLRQQIRAARNSADIVGAMMVMDTPGGTARGNSDLADEVKRFAKQKPMLAFVEDMTASAGVSVASQATQVWANNAAAMYGAMGTYAVLEDLSGAAEKLGVVVHVIKAGDFKGLGEPGSQITEEQIEEVQRIVDRTNESYLSLIASGRNRSVDSIRPLADGRVIFADDAVSNGLLDNIGAFGQAMATLRNLAGVQKSETVQVTTPIPQQKKEESKMDPATLQELEQTFPNANSDWILGQLKAESTLLDASKAYAVHAEEQAANAKQQHEQELADAEARHKKEMEEAQQTSAADKPTQGTGWKPFTTETAGDAADVTGDPVEDFDAAVISYMNRYHVDRLKALDAVKRANPDLTKAYLLATNPSMYAQRVLKERFDALKV